jgi:hypothetical protein
VNWGKNFVSTLSTNNYHGGGGASSLHERLGKHKSREAGFLDAIKNFPDIQVIRDNRYFGDGGAFSSMGERGSSICS